MAIDDYSYDGMDYRDNPYMVLPEGEMVMDEFGKKHTIFSIFLFYIWLMFL